MYLSFIKIKHYNPIIITTLSLRSFVWNKVIAILSCLVIVLC